MRKLHYTVKIVGGFYWWYPKLKVWSDQHLDERWSNHRNFNTKAAAKRHCIALAKSGLVCDLTQYSTKGINIWQFTPH